MSQQTTSQIPLSIDQALASVLAQAQPIVSTAHDLALHAALDRVLARDVISPVNVPPHDNSAMDGFAFHSAALFRCQDGDGIVELAVVGKALAGAAWQGTVGAGECVAITTGAVMPQGCDTVVPTELVTLTTVDLQNIHAFIRFPHKSLFAGDNRRLAGEDIVIGSVALAKGSILSPAALGLVASLGQPTVPVYRRLRVAYFSTGDEILSLGDAPREGAIYDSNRFTMLGMLTKLGVETVDLGKDDAGTERHVVGDDPALLEATFRLASQLADVVITSGGVSVGQADHTKAMMRKLGDVEFWRIAMRPGRPMAVGTLKRADGSRCMLFGLPGNPVAVMVTFLALVRPALLQMMGASSNTTSAPAPLLQAKSVEAIRKKAGRTEYQRGIVSLNANGQLEVRSTGSQGSGVLSSMVHANGLMVLGHEQGDVAAGDWVQVMMFQGAI
jgi:molybdopterin molybdotransferase